MALKTNFAAGDTLNASDVNATNTDVNSSVKYGGTTTLTTTTTLASGANTTYVYLINTTSTITLPTAVSNTSSYLLKNILASNSVTIATTSSQTVDGATLTIPAGGSVFLASDGANWRAAYNDTKLNGKTLTDPAIAWSNGSIASLSDGNGGSLNLGNGTNNSPYIDFNSGPSLIDYDGRIVVSGGTSGVIGRGTMDFRSGTAHFIDGSGNTTVYINQYSALDVYGVGNNHAGSFHCYDSANGSFASWHHRVNSTGGVIGFYYGSSNLYVGQVYTNGSTVTYQSASDYRLKENVADISGGLQDVCALRPVTFNWKRAARDPDAGFIAHEIEDVLPHVVMGQKDAVDTNGNVVPQTVDYSRVVPYLTAAIKDLKAELDAAKERIAALEAKAA